jgi:hypothetical protein
MAGGLELKLSIDASPPVIIYDVLFTEQPGVVVFLGGQVGGKSDQTGKQYQYSSHVQKLRYLARAGQVQKSINLFFIAVSEAEPRSASLQSGGSTDRPLASMPESIR